MSKFGEIFVSYKTIKTTEAQAFLRKQVLNQLPAGVYLWFIFNWATSAKNIFIFRQ